MSVLVTGGTGLLGANVARLLATEHDDEVVVFDLVAPGSGNVLADLKDRVKFVAGSVADLSQVLHAVQDHGVESIVNLAALVTQTASLRPLEALQVNVIGTANILEAARLLGLGRVIVLSSSSVYGAPEDLVTPIREEQIVLPSTGMYPLTKHACEQLTNTYRELYKVDTTSIRPRGGYGPGVAGHERAAPIPRVIQAAARGEPIVKESGADAVFEPSYVKDTARGIVAALKWPDPLPSHVYNVSFGQNVVMSSVLDVLKELLPDVHIEVGPGPWEGVLARGKQTDLTYRSSQRPPQDITRARNDFGYEPAWPIERAIPDYVRWLRTGEYGTF
jgi:UDP-glucose 4-epimerase